MTAINSILMLCTGNICRSPTAEEVLRCKLREAGLADIRVDSAGTHDYHVGEAPDGRATAAARRRGYDLRALRARHLVGDDLQTFDLICALDVGHRDWVGRMSTEAARRGTPVRARCGLITDWGQLAPGRDVPDPYYGGADGFDHVLDLIEDACEGLVRQLRADRSR